MPACQHGFGECLCAKCRPFVTRALHLEKVKAVVQKMHLRFGHVTLGELVAMELMADWILTGRFYEED